MRPIELVALGAISGVAAGSMCALLIVLSHIRNLNRRLAKLEMLRWMSQTPQGVEQSTRQGSVIGSHNVAIGVAAQRATQTAAQNSLAQAQLATTVAAQVQAHAQALATVAAKAVSGPNPSLKKPTP